MKYTLMILLIISLLMPALGQVENPITSGHLMVGGSISFYSQTSKQTLYLEPSGQNVPFTTKEDVFQPEVIFGYYIIDHLALNIMVEANTHAIKQTNSDLPEVYRYRYSTSGIGPLIRYSTDFGLFVQGSVSFGFNNYFYSNKDKWKSHSYSLGSGYCFFIKDVLSIEPSLSYKYTRVSSHGLDGEIKTGGIFVMLGTYLYFDLPKRK